MAGERERPILFSGPMVRAILDGRKSQTRRVVTDSTSRGNRRASQLHLEDAWVDPGPSPAGNPGPYLKAEERGQRDVTERLYPFVFPGDRLWVRETWACQKDRMMGQGPLFYRADGEARGKQGTLSYYERENRWRSPIHMPRWASRITLLVTDVRVERVQDISEADAKAEGFDPILWADLNPDGTPRPESVAYRAGFHEGWDSINAGRGFGWGANPWCWVVTFSATHPDAPDAE